MSNKKKIDKLKAAQRGFKEESAHRRKHLAKPIKNKRYIRGIIDNIVKDATFPRDRGDKTTDPQVRKAVLAKTHGRCYLCHRLWNPKLAKLLPNLYFEILHIDHIVPVSKGGPNHIGNYMPACSRCNVIKSNLTLGEAKDIL